MSKKQSCSLNVRLGAMIGVFALLIAGVVGGTYWVTRAQKSDSLIINLAGRQRMLTQKFNKEFLDEVNDRQIVASAQQRAGTASEQIIADRLYYTKNIIGKLKKESADFRAGADYHEVAAAIPLPATYVREVSESLDASAGYRYDLLSKYNINKAKGLRDEFEQQAWDNLVQDSDTAYVDLVPAGEGVELRYATADVAGATACVTCHNTHSDSPKKDFRLGDLMGMLVVSVPVTEDPVLGRELLEADASGHKRGTEDTRTLFETTLAALRTGGTTYQDLQMSKPVVISAVTDPQIDAQLGVVEEQWRGLQAAVAAARADGMELNSAESVANIRDIRALGMACLKKMNVAVSMLQARSEARTEWMQNIQFGALAVSAVVLVFVLWYIRVRITLPIMQSVSGLNEGADQVDDASAQVSNASQQLAAGAGEQASSLEETSAALEQMAAMTRTNAENAKKANELTDQARIAAQNGDLTVGQLNGAMTAINEASGKISKIIKVIEEIAFQTNLLALNAAVEAARAGEHGKGFAVVADEVRNLAQRAAEAARETTALIEDSVHKAQEGANIAGNVGQALGAIVADVSKVADLVKGIAQASQEQAQGVEQVNSAVAQMDRVTQQNAAGAEESASAAEQLSAQAAEVKTTVGDLAMLIAGQQVDPSRPSPQSRGTVSAGRPRLHPGGKAGRTDAGKGARAPTSGATAAGKSSGVQDFMSLDDGDLGDF